MPLSNFTRPAIPYDNAPLPNDNRFNIITRVLKKPITPDQLDGEFNKLTDNDNILDQKIEDVVAGNIPGSDNPLNANKLLTTDGDGTLSFVSVTDANIDDGAISGTKITESSIGTDQLDDGIITPDKIPNDSLPYSKMDFNEGDIPYAIINTPDNTIPGSKLVAKSITQAKQGLLSVGTPELIDASVTFAKLANEILDFMNALIPIGTIIEYSSGIAPTNIPLRLGWLECNGQAISRTIYASLFARISTGYGPGDGSTTFNLPDRRGRAAVGIGVANNSTNGLITNATANNIRIGGTFGAETQTLTVQQIPPHTHSYNAQYRQMYDQDSPISTFDPGGVLRTTTSTGGGQAHPNVQPSIFMTYYIRAL